MRAGGRGQIKKRTLTDPEPGGASRRDFLAGAGLTGVAFAAAWPAVAPVMAEAAAGGGLPMTAGAERAGVTGKVGLDLEGSEAGYAMSQTGGFAYGDVVAEKLGPDGIQHKHLAGVRYEPITLTVGTGMDKNFYEWISTTLAGKPETKNGAVNEADFNYNIQSSLRFKNAIITEVGFPALDAASKDAAKLTLTFSPESTSTSKGGGKIAGKFTAVQKKWQPSNFRLAIDGLDATKVNKVDALTIKQSIADSALGELRDYTRASKIEYPNLAVTLAAAQADSWLKWHQDFVVKGNNNQNAEKGGSLQFLTPDLKSVLFTLKFEGLGIFKLTPEKIEAGSENVRRLRAEMYCEKITFTYGSEAPA